MQARQLTPPIDAPGPPSVSGHTQVVLHLGHPVAHVRTPGLFNRRCADLGIDAVMVPWDVPPVALAGVLHATRLVANLAGVVVTMPHKVAVAGLCDELDDDVAAIGACNAVRRTRNGQLVGANFDGVGFVRGLARAGLGFDGRSVLLVGAGGAAVAAALAIVDAGAARLVIANRTAARAADMIARLLACRPGASISVGSADPAGFDVIVNATPLGMNASDPLPIDPDRLPSGAIVAEMVMQPDTTPLLHAAARRGAIAHRGVHMIEAQIDLLIAHVLAQSGPDLILAAPVPAGVH